MGILGRFKDIMASNIHSVFNKDEKHPELAIEKYLNQLRSDLGQVNSESEALRMEYQRAKRAVDENLDEQEKLDRYIIKSKQAGNAANARIYEGKLERVKGDGEVLQQKLDKTKFDMDSLSQMNDKLGADISALEAKLSEIKTNGAGINYTDPMYSKINEKADYAIDKANALAELSQSGPMQDYNDVERLADKYDGNDTNSGDGMIDISGPDDE